jgi:ribonuclease P protein component
MPGTRQHTFGRAEKLKSRKVLEALFEKGTTLAAMPLRLLWISVPYDAAAPVKAAFSAPKRRMKLAHDRNRMKRLMREAYRIHKSELLDCCTDRQTGLALLWMAQCNTPPDYARVEEKIILLLKRLVKEHAQSAE